MLSIVITIFQNVELDLVCQNYHFILCVRSLKLVLMLY